MADQEGTGQSGESSELASGSADKKAAQQQVFRIQRVYLKDASFESPMTPAMFIGSPNWKPQVALQINTESVQLENDMLETVLNVQVTVKSEEKTIYLVEVKQAGLFILQGFDDATKAGMLGTYCPNILFPFAREEIASLVSKGGFPQLLLDPVNFDALYAQHLEKARQNAPAPETQQ